MTDTEFQIDGAEVLRIAQAVAKRFKRRCWWADIDDLTSQASVAVLEARTSFDPQVGVPFDGYAARAAALQVTDYLWRQSSPASGGLHDPRKNILGRHRVKLTLGNRGRADGDRPDQKMERPELIGQNDTPDQLDVASWRMAVRRQLRELAARTRDGDLAVEVLVHDRPSGEVMRETGRNAYRPVEMVRRKARKDATLYELWERGPEGE